MIDLPGILGHNFNMTTNYPAPVEESVKVHDFRFHNGEVLPSLHLHYRTIGQLRQTEEGSNAVLILHGTGGTGAGFLQEHFADVLFAPGGVLDAQSYFIILPDNLGHGQSSKPSDGLRATFPAYDYADMIALQHHLVTETLGIKRLRLVMGTSMGGMHSWMWGIQYPTMMDALMPLASLPVEIAGRNRMMRKMIIDAIRSDPGWQEGNYIKQPAGLVAAIHILIMMTSIPLQWQKEAPTRNEADALLAQKVETMTKQMDANDMLYYFAASRNYNPAPDLHKIQVPLLAINSADDQVNPPELGILEREIKKVPRGRGVVLPISNDTRGHGSHSWPVLWQEHLNRLLAESQ